MSIPPNILKELKKPLGRVILDTDITEEKIRKEIVSNSNKIITIGDCTTDKLLSFSIFPDLSIIDGVERRQKRSSTLVDKIFF